MQKATSHRMSFAFAMAAMLALFTVIAPVVAVHGAGSDRWFFLIWLAFVACGWWFVLVAVPWRITIGPDAIAVRTAVRERQFRVSDLQSVQLIQWGDGRIRRILLRFSTSDVLLYDGRLDDVLARLRTVKPDLVTSSSPFG